MKKYSVVFIVAGLAVAAFSVSAEAEENSGSVSVAAPVPIVKEVPIGDLRQELSVKEIYGRKVACLAMEVCPPAPKPSAEILIKAASVTGVASSTITVTIFGNVYRVDIGGSKIVRHYWGESGIDEFSVGDIVNVFGYLDETDDHLVRARTVRNVSIQKVHNVFKGVIESVDASSTSFVMQTEERGRQTVAVNGDTRIIKSAPIVCVKAPCPLTAAMPEVPGSFSDLKVGMKVVVRGLWDKTLSKIQARVIIIGGEENPRPFFKKELPKKFEKPEKLEKLESKAEKFAEKLESKIEKGAGESAEAIRKKMEELQKKIAEILEKLKTSTSTGTSTAQ